MKVISIDNICLQFDSLDEIETTVGGVQKYIDSLNKKFEDDQTKAKIILNKNSTITEMKINEDFLTNEQIVDAARNEIQRCINNGNFVPLGEDFRDPNHDENFHTIESMYVQWAKDESAASEELWKMFEEEFETYLPETK